MFDDEARDLPMPENPSKPKKAATKAEPDGVVIVIQPAGAFEGDGPIELANIDGVSWPGPRGQEVTVPAPVAAMGCMRWPKIVRRKSDIEAEAKAAAEHRAKLVAEQAAKVRAAAGKGGA